jgi:hypothetical protein
MICAFGDINLDSRAFNGVSRAQKAKIVRREDGGCLLEHNFTKR